MEGYLSAVNKPSIGCEQLLEKSASGPLRNRDSWGICLLRRARGCVSAVERLKLKQHRQEISEIRWREMKATFGIAVIALAAATVTQVESYIEAAACVGVCNTYIPPQNAEECAELRNERF